MYLLKNVLVMDVRFEVLTTTMKIVTFVQVMLRGRRSHIPSKCLYSRITPAKSRSFSTKTFSASLTNL